jgi:hypothetical protein
MAFFMPSRCRCWCEARADCIAHQQYQAFKGSTLLVSQRTFSTPHTNNGV